MWAPGSIADANGDSKTRQVKYKVEKLELLETMSLFPLQTKRGSNLVAQKTFFEILQFVTEGHQLSVV